MIIVLTGCTGFIGKKLVTKLVEDGHECIVLVRSSTKIPDSFPKSVRIALYSEMPSAADAVINLAGETVVGRWTTEKMDRILNSRVDVTRQLVTWMTELEVKPKVFLSGSAIGYYGDRGSEIITEETGPSLDKGFRFQVCERWEVEANRAKSLGIRVVNLRIGNVLALGGGMLGQMLAMMKLAPIIVPHNPKGFLPWISMTDLVGMICFALEHEKVSGPINLVAPNSATWSDFYRGLAGILKRPMMGKVPSFMLRLILGKFAEALMESQEIVPQRMLREGYVFHDPDMKGFFTSLKNG